MHLVLCGEKAPLNIYGNIFIVLDRGGEHE
jgi:hypothetical protein